MERQYHYSEGRDDAMSIEVYEKLLTKEAVQYITVQGETKEKIGVLENKNFVELERCE